MCREIISFFNTLISFWAKSTYDMCEIIYLTIIIILKKVKYSKDFASSVVCYWRELPQVSFLSRVLSRQK